MSNPGDQDELPRMKAEFERKTAELTQSLHVVRAMMRATFESTTDGILVTDENCKITGFNQRYITIWKVSREAMDPREHPVLFARNSELASDPVAYIERVNEIQSNALAESFDAIELRDGRLIERTSRILHTDTDKLGRVWTFRDVTQERRAEAALKDEKRVLELLNRTGAILASTLDVQALVQHVTDAATQLSGAQFGAFFYNSIGPEGESLVLYTLSGAPKAAFEKFGHPRATALFGPTFRGEGTIRIADVLDDPRYGSMGPHFGMPKGHLPVRSYLAVPVRSRTGDILGCLLFGHSKPGVFTERSERLVEGIAGQAGVAIDNGRLYDAAMRSAEERKELLDAERAARTEAERVSLLKDEFLATLSHELRTPLSAILGWSQILKRRAKPTDTDFTEGISVIERNARVQTQLIEDLLDMSRIISGKIRLEVQRVDMQDVVNAAAASVRHSADAKEIRLTVVLDPHTGLVRGDPNRLQQCVWNLLSNAIKFTPKGGRVQVSLARVNSHLEIRVTDSGEGIKPEFLPYVFERFRQADASTTRRHGGLGLGLSIVRSLVELHGGTVTAMSEGTGHGATFRIDLPVIVVHDDDSARVHPRSRSTPDLLSTDEPSLEGIVVLAIDDEPDARHLIQRVLESCGATVLIAGSAEEGLDLLRREKPHVLVSDIGMPDRDGYELIRAVRTLSPEHGGRTPAAALTAFARAEDRTRALRAGYQSHIAKPVEAAELIAVVASLAATR